MLFLVIFIEGYVVLASELLAIRLMIPFVGSGTETISIIISAVLLPLAIGYHIGGMSYQRSFAKRSRFGKPQRSVRSILQSNIVISLTIFVFSLSYVFLELFFEFISSHGITNRLAQTSIYCLLFIVPPVYLLGKTVPLVSHYFSQQRLSEITGKMLFFSTTGSFFGSVFSTIVLMTYAGVNVTVIVTLTMLALISLLLGRKILTIHNALLIPILGLLLTFNSNSAMKNANIVSSNAYNTVQIVYPPEGTPSKLLVLNRSKSSIVSSDPNDRFPYIAYIEDNFIAPLNIATGAPRDILVLGAGGFTLGLYDTVNNYTFVDIDPSLKEVAETNFLPGSLAKNKHFVPASARAFLHSENKKYDLIIIDTYTNAISIPMETTTREFFLEAKGHLRNSGILIANIICSPTFSDTFTVRYHNTFSSVFPTSTRQIIALPDPWNDMETPHHSSVNVIYTYYSTVASGDTAIYTDLKNSFSFDVP